MLPGAAAVTAALQHWVDTGVILAVVLANAAIGCIALLEIEKRIRLGLRGQGGMAPG